MTFDEEDRTRFEAAHPPLALEATDEEGNDVRIPQERLPRLLGWTVLLRPWSPPKKTKGGLLLPDQVTDANDYLSYVFQVVALGPLAFTHPRLRGGDRQGFRREWSEDGDGIPWQYWREGEETTLREGVIPPKPGDWVLLRKYSGIQLELEGVRFKVANDDDVIAVIDSPRGWRAYV